MSSIRRIATPDAGHFLLFFSVQPFHGWESFLETGSETRTIFEQGPAMGAQFVEACERFAHTRSSIVILLSQARFQGVAACVKSSETGIDAGAAGGAFFAVFALPFVKTILQWFEIFLSV